MIHKNNPVEQLLNAIESAAELHKVPPQQMYAGLTKKQIVQKIQPVRNSATQPKVKRNQPCPCGSGKKYKNCHAT